MLTDLQKKAKRIKGYYSFEENKKISEIEERKTLDDNSKVKIKVIESLKEYIEFIETLNTSFENPVFYRGQTNANYLLIPNALRLNPENENRLIETFSRYFSNEIDACENAISKLVLMQHYGLATRCLDITENPLAALYFSCVSYKKFRTETTEEDSSWGEITIFQEKSSNNKIKPDRLKTSESSNVSIIANTAFMEPAFSLWHLGSFWKKDANQTYDEKYINLKSIVRESFIVRVPQNNLRIKNQQGAFIIVNANMVYINDKFQKKLTELIIKEKGYINYHDLMQKKINEYLTETETWNLKFKKIKPYEKNNEIDIFETDPFDIKKLFYKDSNNNQLVVLIPPNAKKKIEESLKKFNITDAFIYPDMDTVSNEINKNINT